MPHIYVELMKKMCQNCNHGLSFQYFHIRLLSLFSRFKSMKRFYEDFKQARTCFQASIQGIDSEPDLRAYASILLNRLMFIYFLQRKGLMDDGNDNYLQKKLARTSLIEGPDAYYRSFLLPLFSEGFARPECERAPAIRQKL